MSKHTETEYTRMINEITKKDTLQTRKRMNSKTKQISGTKRWTKTRTFGLNTPGDNQSQPGYHATIYHGTHKVGMYQEKQHPVANKCISQIWLLSQ